MEHMHWMLVFFPEMSEVEVCSGNTKLRNSSKCQSRRLLMSSRRMFIEIMGRIKSSISEMHAGLENSKVIDWPEAELNVLIEDGRDLRTN